MIKSAIKYIIFDIAIEILFDPIIKSFNRSIDVVTGKYIHDNPTLFPANIPMPIQKVGDGTISYEIGGQLAEGKVKSLTLIRFDNATINEYSISDRGGVDIPYGNVDIGYDSDPAPNSTRIVSMHVYESTQIYLR